LVVDASPLIQPQFEGAWFAGPRELKVREANSIVTPLTDGRRIQDR
jgi:hypothetical protein